METIIDLNLTLDEGWEIDFKLPVYVDINPGNRGGNFEPGWDAYVEEVEYDDFDAVAAIMNSMIDLMKAERKIILFDIKDALEKIRYEIDYSKDLNRDILNTYMEVC